MATATRTSVALPEIFSDGDMVLWLRKFELCAKANDCKNTDMLKRLPTLLSGKAFAVFERLAAETKADFKVLTKALTEAFGGDENGKHIAMMAFRSRMRKPDQDIQVFRCRLQIRSAIKTRDAKHREERLRHTSQATIRRRSICRIKETIITTTDPLVRGDSYGGATAGFSGSDFIGSGVGRSIIGGANIHILHTYIQKFILTRWPQQLRADFHEGREFRKKTYYTDRRFKIEQRKNNYYQDIIR